MPEERPTDEGAKDCSTCTNYESQDERYNWRIDRRIPLVTVLSLVIAAASVGGGWVWWFSGQAHTLDEIRTQFTTFATSARRWDDMASSVAVQTSTLAEQERRLHTLEDAETRRDGQLGVVSTKLARIEGLLELLVKTQDRPR